VGTDLKLFITNSNQVPWVAVVAYQVNRDPEEFEKLRAKAHPLPEGVEVRGHWSWEDRKPSLIAVDDFGHRLTYLTAKEFQGTSLAAMDMHGFPMFRVSSEFKQYPPDTKILLFWC
jgi:hypothetical protein